MTYQELKKFAENPRSEVFLFGYESSAITFDKKTNEFISLYCDDAGDMHELSRHKQLEDAIVNCYKWLNNEI